MCDGWKVNGIHARIQFFFFQTAAQQTKKKKKTVVIGMRTGRRRVGFEPLNDDRESVQLEKNDDDDDEESSPREYRPFGNRDEESVGSSLASFPDYPLSHSSKGDNASTFRDERMKRRSTILSKPAPHKSKEVVKAGYMLKEGKVFKTWKNRYFVLRNNHLYYLEKQVSTIVYVCYFASHFFFALGWQSKGKSSYGTKYCNRSSGEENTSLLQNIYSGTYMVFTSQIG